MRSVVLGLCAWVGVAATGAGSPAWAKQQRSKGILILTADPGRADMTIGAEIEDTLIAAAQPGLQNAGLTILGSTTIVKTRGQVEINKDMAEASATSRKDAILKLGDALNVEGVGRLDVTAYNRPDGTPYARVDVIAQDGELCARKELSSCGVTWKVVFDHANTVGRELAKRSDWSSCKALRENDEPPTPRLDVRSGGLRLSRPAPVADVETPKEASGRAADRIYVETGTELVLDACRSSDQEQDGLVAEWQPANDSAHAAHFGTEFRETFNRAGTYSFTLEISEEVERSKSNSHPFVVEVIDKPSPDAGPDKILIQDDPTVVDDRCDETDTVGASPNLPPANSIVERAEDCLPTHAPVASCWYQESGPTNVQLDCEGKTGCSITNSDRLVPGEYVLALVQRTLIGEKLDRMTMLVARRPRIFGPGLVQGLSSWTWNTVRVRVADDRDPSPEVSFRYSSVDIPGSLSARQMDVQNDPLHGSVRLLPRGTGMGELIVTATAKRKLGAREVLIANCAKVDVSANLSPLHIYLMGGLATGGWDPVGHVRVAYFLDRLISAVGVSLEGGRFGGRVNAADDTVASYYLAPSLNVQAPFSLGQFSYDLRFGVAWDLHEETGFLFGVNIRMNLSRLLTLSLDLSRSGLGHGEVTLFGLALMI